MRASLLYNPRLLIERLAEISLEQRRTKRLRGTPAAKYRNALLDSLELLELLQFTPKVIYDIGAHIGTWTLLAKSIYPNAEVIAFEPLESHCRQYRQTTLGLRGVKLEQVALGSATGRYLLHVPNQSDSASLLPLASASEKVFNLRHRMSEHVAVERLDEYVVKREIPLPDVIKLDVQGFECSVLEGGTSALNYAKAVISEVSFKEFYEKQTRFDQLVGMLSTSGLFVHALGAKTPVGKRLDQCDVLFLRA